MSQDKLSIDRFKVMEYKLYTGIMMPSFILATVLGLYLSIDGWAYYSIQFWLYVKLLLVMLLIVYHFCGYLVDVLRLIKIPDLIFLSLV